MPEQSDHSLLVEDNYKDTDGPMTEEHRKELDRLNSIKDLLPDTLLNEKPSFTSSLLTGLLSQQGIFGAMWFLWLVTGSIYYAHAPGLELGGLKGFYMAVNIGYSIGWGDISEPLDGNKWFSTFYVIAGASFVGMALGFFAESIVADCNNWYVNAQIEAKYKKDMADSGPVFAAWIWFKANWKSMRTLVFWLLFVAAGTIGSMITQEWNFINGLYFAVSSMSTGGHWALLGSHSDDVDYFLTGIFAAIGVPIMGVAMATLASMFISTGSIDDTMVQVREQVTEEEINMMQDLGLADRDGEIDKAEFLVLCIVRIGAADPALVKLIQKYFDILDSDYSGTLNFKEITQDAKDLAKQAVIDSECDDNNGTNLDDARLKLRETISHEEVELASKSGKLLSSQIEKL